MTAGKPASFVVWVWTTSAPASNISIRGSVATASYLGSPSFTICPSASGATCKISSLALGQVFELLASVPVATSAPPAAHVQFTAKASAKGALSFSASATDVVVAPSATTAPVPSSAVPPQTGLPPLTGLPPIPGTSVSPVNPFDLFPTVSPSPGSGSLGLPSAKSPSVAHAAYAASTVPIDARLLGGQIIGLAVLAGAVTIAIARLSLRRTVPTAQQPPADQDKS